ncbi:Transcription factor TFIIIB component B'' [Merluccius polli]|uniref:Transcription factor TFIIIB component B n=1 Tax=Merluccius polli TaxID=89951 RepID=A0AA47N2P0_MERPO|nr:Transcription factor TFIIIB component B'' [Merluccius polli]
MFFLAVSMVGTDFSMICQLFPHRARSEIKNKFKKEERENSWRVDKAFKERRRLDLKFFSMLLEKILEFQNNKKKKPKAPSEKKNNKKPKKKTKGRTTGKDLSDVEEDPLEEAVADEHEDPDYIGEDVEDAPSDPASSNTPIKSDSSPPTPKNKSRKRSKTEQAEASVPEEAEATLPEDHSTVNE